MAQASLRIDIDAILANWRALDALSGTATETGAVVKANSYGLGAARIGRALARAGARKFFVASAEEGAALRQALGEGPEIFVFSGHMAGDTEMIGDLGLTPMLNSLDQVTRHFEALPGCPFGVQLDTGMNRLGMESAEWQAVAPIVLGSEPRLIMSHLACSDDPEHPMNARQLAEFRYMTDGLDVPRSLSATGGLLLGPEYHFDVTRPGIGLYGGLPFERARPVVQLSLPVVQIREVPAGETVGYSNAFEAETDCRIATVSAGYADGLHRTLGGRATLWAGDIPCPVVGRISMDLITVDVSHLPEAPKTLDILGPHQGPDDLADVAGTIGYEILTSLGARYQRQYVEGTA
ncbi:alanine racemase [Paenirhodobacter sp. CAU 1674]|uniref:alanine racemase n=1 Tax=Paenirhodobacter sp. CAU 1674 TaxID=3032596 RepID=UPI0023DC7F9C|nr:alanine racemase [Paenirhodobacter sp. CAU 1674]MDF2142731.1 alanine racemase [Paenirhodobacter sp. CAU 1674]